MDLRLTDDEIAFREEVRAFVRDNLPASIRERRRRRSQAREGGLRPVDTDSRRQGLVGAALADRMGRDRLGSGQAVDFPRRDPARQRPEAIAFGVNMVGPVIYTFGSQAQKERFLPRILDLRDWWCQGFSEPGAGRTSRACAPSPGGTATLGDVRPEDLDDDGAVRRLDLRPRAHQSRGEETGGHFLLPRRHEEPGRDGAADPDDRRGARGQRGLLRRRPRSVRRLVGEENKGWDYAKFLFANERNGIARVGISKARLDRVRELAAIPIYGGRSQDRRSVLPRQTRRGRGRVESP